MTKPRYTLLMFKGHGSINWCELDADEWVHVDQNPQVYQIFVLAGSEVTILVASEDWTHTRAEALKIASMFVFGRYQRVEIDLKNLIGQITQGEPHGIRNPPH